MPACSRCRSCRCSAASLPIEEMPSHLEHQPAPAQPALVDVGGNWENWRGWGQDCEAGSGRKGWGLHGGSCWEVGKSIGDQAGDRTAHPEGCPAALPLQGLKQFEATAEWADLLVPSGQRAAAWWLHRLSPPWVLPSHRLLPRLACPGCF